jgi:hypothetical protein
MKGKVTRSLSNASKQKAGKEEGREKKKKERGWRKKEQTNVGRRWALSIFEDHAAAVHAFWTKGSPL